MADEFTEQDFAQAPSEEFSEADFEKQPVIFPSGFSLEQPSPARDSMERAAETAATEAKIFPRPRVRPPGFWETATSPFIPLPKPSEESIRNAPDIQIPGLPTQAQVLGVARSLIKGAESIESPLGLVTLPAAEVQALRVPLAIAFGAMGAKQVGQTAGELAGTPNLTPGEKAEKATDILQGAAMAAAPIVAAPPEFARLNRLSKESRDYALYGKTKTPVRNVLEPARPEEGARPVPADEGRQEAGPRSGKPPDKTQEAPQPGDAPKGQTRILLSPAQIAEQVGGWKFDKLNQATGKLEFTGTVKGKDTTLSFDPATPPEEIAAKLKAKAAEFPLAEEILARPPGTTPAKDIFNMTDQEVLNLGKATSGGKKIYHGQAEGAAWGGQQSRDVLPELQRMMQETRESFIEAQKRIVADHLSGREPNPADEMSQSAEAYRMGWLGAAIDGLNREGNWYTAIEQGLVPPRQAYDELVEKFRTAKPEDKPAIQQQIENLKNKFGGKPPPAEPEKPLSETKAGETATPVPPVETKPAVPETPPEATKAAVAAHSNFTEVGPGKETQTELARHGTPTGLPPGVPDNGPDFPMELMEASRRFGTVVRSRATLPPGLLGMYSLRLAGAKMFDKIEVGDLHNQLTVAHEMGHDLDQLLWPQVNLARTQKSFEARVGSFGTGKEIQGDLIPISELMRGPIAGSKGHQAYRRSATELIADFFALYAHDPERARAMAPKFSKGFEAALARVPDADATVKQLHAGNVDPVVPSPGKGPVQQAAEMPGAVPARPEASPWPREVEAAEASQEVVATGIRDFEAAKQKGRVVEDRWRQLVRSQEDRNDVGAAAEGTGNLEKPGDTRNAVISRLTPAKKDLLKRYRFRVEQERGEINNYLKNVTEQDYLAFLPDYFAHFYVNAKTPAGQQAMARFIKSSPNAKQRKIPTLQEAAELGLKPISQDPAVVFTHYVALNWRVATNLKVIDAIGDLRTAAGAPVVMPKGQAPPEYVRTDNPLLQRVYARKGPKGEVHLWRSGVAVHPDVWPALRQMLDAPASSSLGKAWDVFNSITRANAFAFSLFHDLTLRTASVGQQWTWYNPARGLFRIFEHNPVTGELEVFRGARGLGKELMADEKTVVDAAKHGLRFSWTESESYERNARDTLERLAARWRETPYLGKAARIARDLQRFRQEGLWKNTHDAFKILAYEDLTRKALQEAPQGTDPKLVKQRIASALNDAFGGQEWQTKFWLSPQARRDMSRFFLAPDWCTDEKTRALTKTGWKYHNELAVGDEIMCFDPKWETLSWSPLRDKYVNHFYDGPMVQVANYQRSILMTPEHTCYVRNDGTGKNQIVHAQALHSRHLIPRCAPYVLPSVDAPFTDHFLRLVGWFVTDGYTKRSRKTSGEYTYGKITQSKPAMVALLKSEGLAFHIESNLAKPHMSPKGGLIVTNYHKHIFTIPAGEFKQMARLGLCDGLNWDFLQQLSRRQLELLYDTMMLGNGTGQNRFADEERPVFYMTLLQILLDRPTTFYQQEKHCWRTRTVADRDISVHRKSITHYSGTIWCPSVSTGFWMAEREGLIFITGNTFSTLRSIPFASDVVSTLRGNAPRLAGREPIPTRMEGLAGNAQRLRFWGGELAALAMATLAGQYAIYQAFGRKDLGDQPWVWDNEYGQKRRIDVTPIMRQMPWHKAEDPTRYYVNLGKRPEEILGWFTHGDSTLYSKLSRPAAEIMRQILGTEGEFKAPWKRDHESFIESLPTRAKEFSGQFFPFVFQGNQFALSLPYRKGMTKYKAQQAYESTYELAANPNAFTGSRAFLRGVPNPQGTLDEMVSKITDAAEGNGVNTEPIRQRALSVVRGHWYDEFFKAVDKGDDAKMTRAAEALERLGTTPEGFRESQERRQ